MIGEQFLINAEERAEIEGFDSMIGRGKELSEYSDLMDEWVGAEDMKKEKWNYLEGHGRMFPNLLWLGIMTINTRALCLSYRVQEAKPSTFLMMVLPSP